VDYQRVLDHAALVVDTRNATKQCVRTKARVVTLSSAGREVAAQPAY